MRNFLSSRSDPGRQTWWPGTGVIAYRDCQADGWQLAGAIGVGKAPCDVELGLHAASVVEQASPASEGRCAPGLDAQVPLPRRSERPPCRCCLPPRGAARCSRCADAMRPCGPSARPAALDPPVSPGVKRFDAGRTRPASRRPSPWGSGFGCADAHPRSQPHPHPWRAAGVAFGPSLPIPALRTGIEWGPWVLAAEKPGGQAHCVRSTGGASPPSVGRALGRPCPPDGGTGPACSATHVGSPRPSGSALGRGARKAAAAWTALPHDSRFGTGPAVRSIPGRGSRADASRRDGFEACGLAVSPAGTAGRGAANA